MRVVNDREEKSAPTELGVLPVVAHSMLCAMGIATLLLAPLPMIVAGLRLAEPWTKVVGVFGAFVAVTFLNVPPAFAIISFILSMFIADAVCREMEFWQLLRQAGTLALVVGLATLVASAQLEGTTPLAYWTALVERGVGQARDAALVDKAFPWAQFQAAFFYEGPFLYLTGVFISLWLSIGLASHMGWLEENAQYSGKVLRGLRLPLWVSIGFLILFVAVTFPITPGNYLLGGAYRIAGVLMFIQGCVCVAELMERRMVRPRVRTLIFSVAILVGFYAVMGMGVMAPWIFRKKISFNKRLEEAI